MANETSLLFVTLYTDADIHGKLAQQIRANGFDAISAFEAGTAHLSDVDQLAYAASQRRAIPTCNAKDYAPLYDKWWRAGRQHHGIIVSEQLSLGEMLRRVLCLMNTVSADEMADTYRNLCEFTS